MSSASEPSSSESGTPKPRAAADDALAKIVTKDWFRAGAPKVIPPMHRFMRRTLRRPPSSAASNAAFTE